MTNTNEIFNMPFDQLVNQYASADVTPAVTPAPAPATQDFVVPASALPENVTGTAPVSQSFDDILKQAGVTNAQIAQPVAQPAIQVQPGMTIGDVAQVMNQQPIPAVTMADGSQVVDPFGAVVTTQPSVPTTFEQPATPVETVPAQIVAPFAETADLPIQAQPVAEAQPAPEVQPVVEVQPVAETQPVVEAQPVEAVETPTEEPAKKSKRARKSKAKAKVDAPIVDAPTVEVPVEVPTVAPATDDAFLDAETVAQIRAEIRQVVRHEVKAAIVEAFNEFSKVFGSGC